MEEIKGSFLENLHKEFKELKEKQQEPSQTKEIPQTYKRVIQTYPLDITTDNYSFEPLNPWNMGISIGNQGVPTDKQTNQQTNRHTENVQKIGESIPQNPIKDAAKILESLDSLKKEIRLKFKRLTDKEIEVFSILYQLDEECGFTDYKTIASKLNLTESSIRDYIGRLISKGIPVDKTKINNKNIQLSISQDLKKVASLATILELRSL